MSVPWRLLALNYPNQAEPFRIGVRDVEKAVARSKRGPLAVSVDVRFTDDPDLGDRIAEADAILGPGFPRELVAARATRLKLVQATAAGVDHLLPLDWLPPGAAFSTANGVHAGPKLMEWAMMVLLMLHTNMPHFVTAQRDHSWSKLLSGSIAGRTALIFGTGPVGRTIAAGAGRLGVTTTGVRRRAGGIAGFTRTVTAPEAAAILPEADFIILAAPLTLETRNMIGEVEFRSMRPGAGFANFGRGGLVDQWALIRALESGHLSGAVIDVTSPEPPETDSPLWDAPRLIITPHLSSDDPDQHVRRVLDILIENMHLIEARNPIVNEIVDR